MNPIIHKIEAFQRGDKEAFGSIYTSCYNRVFFSVYDMIRDEQTAKDITQNVFIIVYKKLDQLLTPEAFFTWLDRITSNCTMHELKNLSNTNTSLDPDQFVDDSQLPNESYNSKEVVCMIVREMKQLPPHLRDVALLRFCQDLSIQEIAQKLKIPEGTVKSRINAIKKALQHTLSQKMIHSNHSHAMMSIMDHQPVIYSEILKD